MKNVLFLGGTTYDLERENKNLEKKFSGLKQGMNVFVVARGKPWHKRIWGCEFYLVPSGWGILKWPVCFFRSFYLCFKKKIQTIVTQSPLIDGLLGVILKKIFKAELIIELHGDWIATAFLYKRRERVRFLKKIPEILGKLSLQNADKIRGVAKYLIEKAKKIALDKKYFLFPTFTDVDFFLREKEINFNNFILFVGYLNKVKGVKYLIQAFSEIKDKFPEFKLVIVGEGPERKNYQLSIINYQLQEKVEFKGELSLEGVKEIMKNCYCFVSPSLSEGLPLVLREAMALSKPVIASNVGGNSEIVKDGQNGFLFEPEDSEELAKKLRILLKDKNLAIEMGQRGKEIIRKNFSNEKFIENYIQIINS